MGNNGGMGSAVEVDETYIGGKEQDKHAHKKLHAGRGAAVGKVTQVGLSQFVGVSRSVVSDIGKEWEDHHNDDVITKKRPLFIKQ